MFFTLASSKIGDKMRALYHPNHFIYDGYQHNKERDVMFLFIFFSHAVNLLFLKLLSSYETYLNYATEP